MLTSSPAPPVAAIASLMGRDRETNGQSSKLQRGHRQQTIANRSEDNVSVEGSIPEATVPEIDTSKPHPARMYDYYLGGKNHFAADRATAEMGLATWRAGRIAARENRAFLGRAVRFLVAEAGVTQFLDVGTGLPTTNNVHEVAQAIEPSSRVVYADNDPLVLAHARALLTSSPEGRTAYIHADLRDPQ